MSRIKFEAPFQEYRGKICKHSNVIYKQVYDTKYTSQICHPHEGAATEAQEAHRTKFKQVRKNVLALTEEEKQQYATTFKKQQRYKSLQGYIFAKEFAKLSIIMIGLISHTGLIGQILPNIIIYN